MYSWRYDTQKEKKDTMTWLSPRCDTLHTMLTLNMCDILRYMIYIRLRHDYFVHRSSGLARRHTLQDDLACYFLTLFATTRISVSVGLLLRFNAQFNVLFNVHTSTYKNQRHEHARQTEAVNYEWYHITCSFARHRNKSIQINDLLLLLFLKIIHIAAHRVVGVHLYLKVWK